MLARPFINTFRPLSISTFSTIWSHIPQQGKDAIFGIVEEFNKDKSPNKVNLSVGAYRDNNGKPFVLNSVTEATKIFLKKKINHEYLPIAGMPSFVNRSLEFAYGNDCVPLKQNKICAVQSLSGTGALKLGMTFLKQFYPYSKSIYIPKPSWPQHRKIATHVGLKVKEYSYYSPTTKNLNFEGLVEDLSSIPKQSVVLLHACAHNPTGVDITQEQWKDILDIVKQRQHTPFFDMAYQGFASGNPINDSYPVRLFANNGVLMLLAQSYAKNLGLYGERVGCLSIICNNEKEVNAIKSQLQFICRNEYSNPPKYGAFVASTILASPMLRNEWLRELEGMSMRIKDMRKELKEGLEKCGSTHNWDHLVQQIGMFAYTGLSKDMAVELRKKHHVYLLDSGRISVAGLNEFNVERVAKAFHEVTKGKKF